MKISVDIGGVITRWPDKIRPMLERLQGYPGCTVYLLTDMAPSSDPEAKVAKFGFVRGIDYDEILCADYATHGEQCKAVLIREHGIDIHIDDYPSYCVTDSDCLTLFVWPRPDKPYDAITGGGFTA